MKATRTRSVEQIVEDQVQQWQRLKTQKKPEAPEVSVISISRECGSEGTRLGELLAEELGFNFFDREIIQEIAKSAKISDRLLGTLDEKGLNLVEETIAAAVNERHLWPDQFLRHLMKVIGAIGRHGRAVIVGRGANFVLPADANLRIRVIASLDRRVQNLSKKHQIAYDEAQKLVLKTDADRRSFTRKYFYADMSDPLHYDLIINTDRLDMRTAVQTVKSALEGMKNP
jgi:cytidylate kinase